MNRLQRKMSSALTALMRKKCSRSWLENALEKCCLSIEPDDVFFVSYPRSGNTWLRHILVLLHPGASLTEERNLHHIIPSLEARPALRPESKDIPRPRILKTHGGFDPLYPRVIYIYRDGRDATYSYYEFSTREFGFEGTFKEFILQRSACHGYRWHEHVASWLNGADKIPVHFVRYEDMQERPAEEVRDVIDFLGWNTGDGEIERAVRESSIDRMRAKEKNGMFLAHVRKGRVGDWRDHYTEEELALFESYSLPMLRRLGYSDR